MRGLCVGGTGVIERTFVHLFVRGATKGTPREGPGKLANPVTVQQNPDEHNEEEANPTIMATQRPLTTRKISWQCSSIGQSPSLLIHGITSIKFTDALI